MPRTSTLPPEFPSDQFVGNFVEYMMPVDETMENRSEEGDVDVELEIEEDEEIIEEEREVDNDNDGECVGFRSEINPLDFVEDEAAGVQLYKQFERIEYEALAKRKRDADHQSEGLSKKPRLEDETTMMNYEEMLEAMTYGGKRRRRRSGKQKLRGRRKGSKNKLNPEVSRKLGEATLHYARGNHEEAIKVLNEVVLMAPNLPYPYHRLGSVYNDVGAKKKAIACYMIAAFLSPKDTSLWKHLLDLSIEQGYIGQAWYCLSKAITSDPGDISLRRCRASLSLEVEDYGKAAESYDQIFRLCPDDFDALNNAIMLYKRCSKLECGVNILKWYVKEHGYEADLSMVDMLVSLCIENHNYSEALQHIENAKKVHCPGSEWLMYLTIKEGICCAHLGDMEKAEVCFSLLQQVNAADHVYQIIAVADTLMALQHSECAFNYYKMLEGKLPETGSLYLKIAKCCMALKRRKLAIEFFYKALLEEEGDIEVRLMLASVLLDEGSDNEAISLLSPPPNAGLVKEYDSNISIPWWLNARIKLKLSSTYKSKGMHEAFVDVVFPLVHKSLVFEVESQKVRRMKRLSRCTLKKRVKVLDDSRKDFLFHNFRPLANRSDKSKANRAKRKLESETAKKEKKKSAALAAGLDWISDDSDEDNEEVA
ncbi:General transcription factor 3C polypeptide 3-like protein, partial [Drosera capensis]